MERLFRRLVDAIRVGPVAHPLAGEQDAYPDEAVAYPLDAVKLLSIVYVIDGDSGRVLLGRKSRGFGCGKWNGFGGKYDATVDRTLHHSAARELEEESGLRVPETHLFDPQSFRRVGVLFYQYPRSMVRDMLEVHVFVCKWQSCEGSIGESDEMNPIAWFSPQDIPLPLMWADDPFWLPALLAVGPKGLFSPNTHIFSGLFRFFGFDRIKEWSLLSSQEDEDLFKGLADLKHYPSNEGTV